MSTALTFDVLYKNPMDTHWNPLKFGDKSNLKQYVVSEQAYQKIIKAFNKALNENPDLKTAESFTLQVTLGNHRKIQVMFENDNPPDEESVKDSDDADVAKTTEVDSAASSDEVNDGQELAQKDLGNQKEATAQKIADQKNKAIQSYYCSTKAAAIIAGLAVFVLTSAGLTFYRNSDQ